MNDYEAHLSSYDHSHRQRMKDVKQMVKDPTASSRARKAEAKADGLISIKLGEGAGGSSGAASAGSGAGFKKGGFKKSGFKSAFTPVQGGGDEEASPQQKDDGKPIGLGSSSGWEGDSLRKQDRGDENNESDTEDEGYEGYDPRYPTD